MKRIAPSMNNAPRAKTHHDSVLGLNKESFEWYDVQIKNNNERIDAALSLIEKITWLEAALSITTKQYCR